MTSAEIHISVHPRDDKDKIDSTQFIEANIPFGMRFKEFWLDRPDDSTVVVNWYTQDCHNSRGMTKFKAEARRWGEANGFLGSPVHIQFKLVDRSGDWRDEFILN